VTFRRLLAAGTVGVALLTATCAVGAVAAPSEDTAVAKKRCHIVKKKVHGKIKRVRVCAKPKPKTLNVSVRTDKGRASSAVVGVSGGTVSAEAAGGTKLTLAVPSGALSEDTTLTLTPVSSMVGLPKGLKLVSGVQFGPEGLAFAKPVTLTITTARGGVARGLAWFERGKDTYRYPSTRAGNEVRIRIAHFSGVAVAQGSAAAYLNVPSILWGLRARYTASIKPLLQRALSDDGLALFAVDEAFGWEREAELVGLAGDLAKERAEIRELLPKILQNALNKASERCAAHDLTQAARMLKIERFAKLMGIHIAGAGAIERATKCLHFELDFTSTLSGTATIAGVSGRLDYSSTARATVPVQPAADLSALSGEAQIAYPAWDASGSFQYPSAAGPITVTLKSVGVTLGTPLRVLALEIDFGESQSNPPKISMRISPAKPHESIEGCDSYNGLCETESTYRLYFSSFAGLYAGQADPKGGYRVDGWSYLGGTAWAQRVYQRTSTFSGVLYEGAPGEADLTVSENTTYLLRHTPES
jgi:hypothetical protein